jgi:FkbM family methyltransferase
MDHRESAPARVALELLSSAVATVRAKQPCRMRLDGPRWIHSYRDGAIVSPVEQPDVPPPAATSARMRNEFCHLYEPGREETVVDVGAGMGEALLLFSSLVGPGGRVLAIEAHPLLFGCLQRAIDVNHLTNVEAIHVAVTGEPGPVKITDEDMWYGNTIVASGGDGAIDVDGRTLDQILNDAGVESVGLLKMNIEGAERLALPGMKESLALCHAVAVSCHDFRVEDPQDPAFGVEAFRTKDQVRASLEEAGFVVKTRDADPSPSTRDVVYGLRPLERGASP